MFSKLKKKMLDTKLKKAVNKARKQMITAGLNPEVEFLSILEISSERVMEDHAKSERPLTYLLGNLEGLFMSVNHMGIDPRKSEQFMRVVKRLESMVKANGGSFEMTEYEEINNV